MGQRDNGTPGQRATGNGLIWQWERACGTGENKTTSLRRKHEHQSNDSGN